jgi:guanyl-specific ribonuclease Sa
MSILVPFHYLLSMKRTILFLSTLAFLATVPLSPGPASSASLHPQGQSVRYSKEIPARAVEVYEFVIRNGKAPKGHVGGRVWHNREHRLPAGGDYREYDVNPKVRGRNRGAERIIVDIDRKSGWYTGDHYRTFTPIQK